MSRRKHHQRPPTGPAHKSGLTLTFAPSDDEPDPAKMIDVYMGGVTQTESATKRDDHPHDDRVANPPKEPGESR